MSDEEIIYQAAVNALAELATKDMSLATESFIAHEAGDHSKAEAAENARAALVPSKLKAEDSVLRAQIAGAIAARESVPASIRRDAGDLPLHRIEEIVGTFTRTFDDDVWRAEQQLASNLEEQAQLGI